MLRLDRVFGSRNSRLVRQYSKRIVQINEFESKMQSLSDEQLQQSTDRLRNQLTDHSLDDILAEAFAVCREAAKRTLNMRHYDVQLIGGMVLHQGKISEMRTGEGKTLVATLAVYLNALSGNGVHVVTVNDYLARRDAQWMGQLYRFLGLSVGVVHTDQDRESRIAAYASDITYGTNNEFGFDYLRDNMVFQSQERAQKKHHFAIVDEVDSILIDEARTPLIISGATQDNLSVYPIVDHIPGRLKKQFGEISKEGIPSSDYKIGDYSVDEKGKQVHLTDRGHEKVERFLALKGFLSEGSSLYDVDNIVLMQHVNAAIRAHVLYQKNTDYIIEDGQIVIIDEFTGRKMSGRRWSDGLHQAVEAKEKVKIQTENQTLASITFQNYFRLYDKLAGMTGTADTEAVEFQQIYQLEVVIVPTHLPTVRKDHVDVVFLSQKEKFLAVVEDIQKTNEKQQPVLIGTSSIETSELISKVLMQKKIKHEILNAKQHLREAFIIAQAGNLGAVTIATNMAGRGTDIVLGGNVEYSIQQIEDITDAHKKDLQDQWRESHQKVVQLGGLYVIGTERNESRRVDNQLRGRSGRQGDPGESRFYLSLDDGLMRIFASDRMRGMMQKLGLNEGESIQHKIVSKAVENAQSKVEGRNYEIRKQLLEYDNVINDQRKLIYDQRNQLIDKEDLSVTIVEMREAALNEVVGDYLTHESLEEQWDIEGLEKILLVDFSMQIPIRTWVDEDSSLNATGIRKKVIQHWDDVYENKENIASSKVMRHLEKTLLLQVLDFLWKEHLASLDYLRQGMHLRGYAQKNPVQEYKRESFDMFQTFLSTLRRDTIKFLSQVPISDEPQFTEDPVEVPENTDSEHQPLVEVVHKTPLTAASAVSGSDTLLDDADDKKSPYTRQTRKVGRNEPCPCGSGKKYKVCHGVNQ